jgi:hypothetical protein
MLMSACSSGSCTILGCTTCADTIVTKVPGRVIHPAPYRPERLQIQEFRAFQLFSVTFAPIPLPLAPR